MGLNPGEGDVLHAAARREERFVSCCSLEQICDTCDVIEVTTGSTDLRAMDWILADDAVVTSWTIGSSTCQQGMKM